MSAPRCSFCGSAFAVRSECLLRSHGCACRLTRFLPTRYWKLLTKKKCQLQLLTRLWKPVQYFVKDIYVYSSLELACFRISQCNCFPHMALTRLPFLKNYWRQKEELIQLLNFFILLYKGRQVSRICDEFSIARYVFAVFFSTSTNFFHNSS